jgi:hypothetical protein
MGILLLVFFLKKKCNENSNSTTIVRTNPIKVKNKIKIITNQNEVFVIYFYE